MSGFPQAIEAHKKKIVYGLAALVALGAGYQLYRVMNSKPTVAKIVPIVRTVTVGALDPSSLSTYPGAVHGRYESSLAFQVGGKINARLVNLGDKVAAGQILMTLDPKDVAQAAEANNAALEAAISSQRLAQKNAERYRALYAQGATSKAILDMFNTQLDSANSTLRQAQAQAQVSNNQLGYTQLKSDTAGVVAALSGETGMVVGAGTPVVTVVRDGEREIRINVPENALGQLKPGQKATVSFWALNELSCSGYIREIASMADPLTKTYRVNVALDEMPAELRLGMTAKVTFEKNTIKGSAFVLPATALYNTGSKAQVWLVKDGHAELAEVTVAGYAGNEVLISKGLKAGDRVVTAGLSKLVAKSEVRILEEAQQNKQQGSEK